MRKFSLIAAAVAMTAGSLTADIQIGKGLTVGGYLDMAYKSVSNDAVAVADTAGFDAITAEIDFGMDFGNGLTATIDLEGSPNTDGTTSSIDVEQARIDYAFGMSTLTLGKFDTFIGLEGLEAPDLYQFSNSLTFALEPTQHEGIAYAYNGGMWNVAAAIVNGLSSDDTNTSGDSKELSYAIHLGLAPVDSLSFNVNYAIDNSTSQTAAVNIGDVIPATSTTLASLATVATAASTTANDTNLWTIDASYSNHGWTVGAEYVNMSNENGAGADTDTDAWMLMANYMFTEQFGLTARYSESEQTTGAAVNHDKDEITVAASYAFTPNWSGLLEYRMDDDNTAASADSDTIAIETILTF